MNPPPYRPPQESKNPIVRQILLASLLAVPVVAVFAFLVVHSIAAQKKAAQTRAAWNDIASSANHAQSDLKKNFDPKKGITNADFSGSDELRAKLQDASQKLSGDDAVFARVGAEYLERVQAAATNYQAAALKLRNAHVLGQFDSSDMGQITSRREIVQEFMAANTALKEVILHSEDEMRSELTATKIRSSKIEAYMKGFHSSAAPRNTLTVKIRQCDERIGNAMLDILNTLEAQSGHWKANPAVDKIRFEDNAALDTYNNDLATIRTAGAEQVNLQKMLVNLPAVPEL